MTKAFVRLLIVLASCVACTAYAETRDNSQTQRIVSAGGDATEILYALGLEDRIVAVDSTSLYPERALKEKPNVGYVRQLTTEGILSTGATLIVANAQAGPPDVVRALKSSNVRYETLPGNEKPENIAEKVRFVGELMGVRDAAEHLASDITKRLTTLSEKRTSIEKRLRAVFILGITGGRMMIGGAGTTADTVLTLAGADNAAASLEGYKPLTDEALISLAPDVIVTIRRDGEGDTAARVAALAGFAATPAGKAGRIITMDAHYLLGFGPRTPQAAEDLMASLYPEAR